MSFLTIFVHVLRLYWLLSAMLIALLNSGLIVDTRILAYGKCYSKFDSSTGGGTDGDSRRDANSGDNKFSSNNEFSDTSNRENRRSDSDKDGAGKDGAGKDGVCKIGVGKDGVCKIGTGKSDHSRIKLFLDYCTSKIHNRTVPHAWFWHYYAFATAYTIVAIAVLTSEHQRLLYRWNERETAIYTSQQSATRSASLALLARTNLLLILFLAHVSRRLFECLMVLRPSQSSMSVLQYAAGYFFYIGIVPSLFIDSLRQLQALQRQNLSSSSLAAAAQNGNGTALLPFAGIVLLLCSWIQWDCHKILAGLRDDGDTSRYTVPRKRWFRWLVCPHYTAEIGIYCAFVVLTSGAAFGGIDITLLCAVCWSILILSTSAIQTNRWGRSKFRESWPKRWLMLPGLF